MSSKVSLEDANAFFAETFSGSHDRPQIVEMDDGRAVVQQVMSEAHRRPGGYVSGPTQMSLVDTAVYFALFTRIGIVPMAVTSSLNMSFLRPLIADHVEVEARLMKLGRTLGVAEAWVRADAQSPPASHAVVTYAIPGEGAS